MRIPASSGPSEFRCCLVGDRADRDAAVDGDVDRAAHQAPASLSGAYGRIASTPVAARPMISFWISDVPS